MKRINVKFVNELPIRKNFTVKQQKCCSAFKHFYIIKFQTIALKMN